LFKIIGAIFGPKKFAKEPNRQKPPPPLPCSPTDIMRNIKPDEYHWSLFTKW